MPGSEKRDRRKEPRVAKRSPLAEKLDEVKDRIAKAAAKARREPVEVTLVAVTKTAAPEQIREVLQLGVAVRAAVHLAEQIDSMPNLQMVGLMTMAPLEAPEAKVRQAFSRTREIFEELKWHKIGGSSLRHLSMGMSHDFEPAIAEGATM